jgi:prolycopene isomerase
MIRYDAVVVGAGNSGLTAAIRMALAGKKTLLIEQHNLPGGCASSFRRGRFEFEPSLHELCDYGSADNPGDLYNLFKEFGIENRIGWCELDDCFRVVSKFSDGSPMDVTMPSGKEAFIKKMEEYAPGSREGMETFFELAAEVLEAINYTSASAGNADSNVLKEKYPNFLRTGAYPTSKVFDAIKLPKKAQDIMSIYWSYLGVDMERLAFVHYAAMVYKYITKGAYIPKHTSHEISMALLERFRELGGDIWFNTRAAEFLFDGDSCCGVRTNQGDIMCQEVLANINPNIIYGKMMPKDLVPARERKLAGARKISGRMYVAYFALNKSKEELGIKDYSIFMPHTSNSPEAYKQLDSMNTNEYSILCCYNVANLEFSPEGTCVVSFTTFYNFDDWGNVEIKDYFKKKNEVAKQMIMRLKEKTGIDISDCIEEMEIATPWTFSRYLNVPEGAVYGYETSEWDAMMARMMMLKDDYPVKGLWPIGAAGPRGDGYSSTYICGNLIARLALKEMEGGK